MYRKPVCINRAVLQSQPLLPFPRGGKLWYCIKKQSCSTGSVSVVTFSQEQKQMQTHVFALTLQVVVSPLKFASCSGTFWFMVACRKCLTLRLQTAVSIQFFYLTANVGFFEPWPGSVPKLIPTLTVSDGSQFRKCSLFSRAFKHTWGFWIVHFVPFSYLYAAGTVIASWELLWSEVWES